MSVISALPILLKLATKADIHRPLLGCNRLPRFHPVDGMGETPSLDWSVCPLDVLTMPEFGHIFKLDKLATIAPLSGWPDRYAPWAVEGLLTLRQMRGE